MIYIHLSTNEPWQVGYTCELTNEIGYKSYSMITCGVYSFSHNTYVYFPLKMKEK